MYNPSIFGRALNPLQQLVVGVVSGGGPGDRTDANRNGNSVAPARFSDPVQTLCDDIVMCPAFVLCLQRTTTISNSPKCSPVECWIFGPRIVLK